MNFNLSHIPERTVKPRKSGINMMMDKGLSLIETEAFIQSSAQYTDLVKFGFGTAIITANLEEKIKLYKQANINPYFGGTLFEAFIARNKFDEYRKLISKYKLEYVEISDGSIVLNHDEKCKYIEKLAKDFVVLSEVGSKEAGIIISPGKWIRMMGKEIQAGAWKVIAEGRESGTVGIFRPSGHAHTLLINKITAKIKPEDIMWEAPKKEQQVWFIKHFGANVNLGNIAPNEIIALECLRLGLRGDTFFTFLPPEVAKKIKHPEKKK